MSAGVELNGTSAGSNRSRWVLALGAILALVLAGCSSQNSTSATVTPAGYYAPPTPDNYRGPRTEVASWYGPGFAGRRTSNGEIYNPEGLTAASKTLPLGSHVRVTNPDTGRSVVVRINDRGPYVRGRSLDLSHGAAQRIGLTGKGVGRVEVASASGSTSEPSYETAPIAKPAPRSRTAVYAYSLLAAGPSNLGGSYLPSLGSSPPSRPSASASSRTSRRHYRYSRSRNASSRRMVSNPIGSWIASGFRF